MRGLRRAAILGALVLGSAACEALVGITDRALGPGDAGAGADVGAGADTGAGPGADTGAGPGADTGAGPGADTGAGPDADTGAGPGADTGAGPDAISDASAEATVPTDAGPSADGADAAPVDPDVPCAQQPAFLFCEDFDSVTTVGQNWNYVYSSADGGSVTFDTVHFVSSPKSAQTVAPALAGGTQVQLGKTIGTLYTAVRLAFDFRLDLPSYTGLPQIGIAQLYVGRQSTGSSPMTVDLVLGPGSAGQVQVYVGDAGAPVTLGLPAPPPPQTWVRFAINYDTTTGLSLYENGQFVGALPVGNGAPGNVQMILGVPFLNALGSTETVKVELDNVVVTGH